jgi:hypothetical protein
MPTDNQPSNSPGDRREIRLFLLLCVVVLAGVLAYAMYARRSAVPAAEAPAAAVAADPAALAAARREPHVLFRVTALGPSYGRIGIVPVQSPDAQPIVTALSCDRVHASALDGLCLQASRGVLTTYKAIAFDEHFVERHAFNLAGAPSRTRVSQHAPLASSTVFVSGDSYAAGSFSTRTTVYDLRTNKPLGDLEEFAVTRDGVPFKQQDFNFWGVTFRDDGDRFYATLSTGGKLSLVEGSIRARRMTVIAPDVECPSLSRCLPTGAAWRTRRARSRAAA